MRTRRLNRWQRITAAGLVLAFGVAAVALLRPSAAQSHRVVVASASESEPSSEGNTTSTEGVTAAPVSSTSTTTARSAAPDESPLPVVAQPEPCAACGAPGGFPTLLDLARPSRPDDFTGTLTVEHDTFGHRPWDGIVVAGESVWVQLSIRNVSDDVIDPSNGDSPNLQVVCAADLTVDGRTNAPLEAFVNYFFVTNPPLGPGFEGGAGPVDLPMTDADIGTMTCEGVIAAPGVDGRPIARLTNIPPVTFTVVPAPSTTTAPTTTASVGEQQRG